MTKNYLIINRLTGETRPAPLDAAAAGLSHRAEIESAVEMTADEVLVDAEREVFSPDTGKVVRLYEPPSNHVYREFLALREEHNTLNTAVFNLTERVSVLTERVAALEATREAENGSPQAQGGEPVREPGAGADGQPDRAGTGGA